MGNEAGDDGAFPESAGKSIDLKQAAFLGRAAGPWHANFQFESRSMHELSIVASIVDTVTESAAAYPGARVKEVRLRVGALAAVIEDSLQFCWEISTEDSPLKGAKLVVDVLPVVMHCEACNADVEIKSLQSFRCPKCGEPVMDMRQGRELEIDSIEIDEADVNEADKVEETV
jgi:hydrogenase nickel incorporation protein HypA/HybF